MDAATPEEREFLKRRLDTAREFLGTIDILQQINDWKMPEER